MKILTLEVSLPNQLGHAARDYVHMLLQKRPADRLGGRAEGMQAVKTHPFYQSQQWDDIRQRRLPMPYLPARHCSA